MKIRAWLEEREETLSPFAARSRLSRGRLQPEEPSPTRTAFQRDRDRIIHCKAFRRLKHKTQVFIAPAGDHYVTRLTHTLEVSQIARSIARGLNLNEDLTEAIALGHDLGHTPFGHIGEDVLNEIAPSGFRHNEQSLRVVDQIENGGRGLNLTFETREGIVKHSKSRMGIFGEGWETVGTLEGQICKLADVVAYISHDVDDALRAGVITESDLPAVAVSVMGRSRSERINALVCDIIDSSWDARGEDLTSRERQPIIGVSPPVNEAMNALRDFLFDRVYDSELVNREADVARLVVRRLYEYFTGHEDQLPDEFRLSDDPLARRVVDYVAGMTDQYALQTAKGLGLLA
ncbi:MAG: deoxyguanosinetriphosphate triphosphohydrolase [Dehalococcoidia bacterium]|nr:deoxyguanosinetriphosphate triphosphohydrolase [Dehalococcoidia bacterium]